MEIFSVNTTDFKNSSTYPVVLQPVYGMFCHSQPHNILICLSNLHHWRTSKNKYQMVLLLDTVLVSPGYYLLKGIKGGIKYQVNATKTAELFIQYNVHV
jgi:hypothetical protein